MRERYRVHARGAMRSRYADAFYDTMRAMRDVGLWFRLRLGRKEHQHIVIITLGTAG